MVKGLIEIQLTQGRVAVIDAADFDLVKDRKWQYVKDRGGKEYAVTSIKRNGRFVTARLHRILLNAPDNVQVDHRNGNGLDCRRQNIRLATPTQNQGNKRLQKNNKTGYKGVSYDRSNQKYIATISVNGKGRTLGYFTNPRLAADAYDRAARCIFGEFALTNQQIRHQRRIQHERSDEEI